MTVYVCGICGYEYDPNRGDSENGIAEQTDFEELPDNWCCPMCGAAREDFEVEVRGEGEEY